MLEESARVKCAVCIKSMVNGRLICVDEDLEVPGSTPGPGCPNLWHCLYDQCRPCDDPKKPKAPCQNEHSTCNSMPN